MKSLADRCRAIELLVVDVDGVLTAGQIVYADNDAELKAFHVRDGSGLKIWRGLGKRAAMITGRESRAVLRRARELDIEPVMQGAADKLGAYRQVLMVTGMRPEQTCCIGDDVPDLPLLANCGLGVAVADASPEARADAHHVTQAAGGWGAVRETIELILRCQGLWADVIGRFRLVRLD
jgi:3-deoxy-D-manno-octulosonate 8-phosphate phosphatase (KDO 8-P phosphatase)